VASSGNQLYMLASQGAYDHTFSELVSSDNGVTWTDNHRTFSRPECTNQAQCFVSDAGYLKDKSRRIAAGHVIVGPTGTALAKADLGAWHLYSWADAPSAVPAAWTNDASAVQCPTADLGPGGAPDYQGSFDASAAPMLTGWAWDLYRPTTPLPVEIWD